MACVWLRVIFAAWCVLLLRNSLFAFYPLALHLQVELVALLSLVLFFIQLKRLVKAELPQRLVRSLIFKRFRRLNWPENIWIPFKWPVIRAYIDHFSFDTVQILLPIVHTDVAKGRDLRLLSQVNFIFELLRLIRLYLIAVPVIAFVSDDFLIDMLVFIQEFEFPFAVFRSKIWHLLLWYLL